MTQPSSSANFRQNIKSFFTAQSGAGDNLVAQDQPQAQSQPQPQPNEQDKLDLKAMSHITTGDKLQLLDEVIGEIERSREKAKPQPPAKTPPIFGSRKEAPEGGSANLAEQSASIQYVEEEKSPELSPEVEKFIQEVKQDDRAPESIVIAGDQVSMPADDQYVSERVVVLPITPEIEKQGKKKSAKFSIRWLVEWSQKIIKMFQGKVVYREA